MTKDQFPKEEDFKNLKFFVGPGNNEKGIRRVMAKRQWWEAINPYKKKKEKYDKKINLQIVKNLENSDFSWVQTTR